MKIGILIYSLTSGGAERQVSYMTSYFLNKGIDTCLILMNDTLKYDLPINLEIFYLEKSSFDESGSKKALKIPILAWKYAKFMKEQKITHSISMLTRSNLINIVSRKLTSHKFKLITNELAFPTLQYSYGGLQSKFNKYLISKLYKKSDLLIGNSNGNVNDLVDNFNMPANKTHVIHNPIDIAKIEDIPALDSFFDNTYFNLITIGRLDIGKNHMMLIRALYQLSNPKIRLYIVGEGFMKEKLDALVRELNMENQIFLMGYESNPFKYLKTADLFVFGSNHEGFPNVLMEAMACGLPILTTNCQSGPSEIMELETPLKDLMITDYGILVPIKNEALMSKGIDYFFNDNAYLEKCKKQVKIRIKDFEKNKILQQYLDAVYSVD